MNIRDLESQLALQCAPLIVSSDTDVCGVFKNRRKIA